MGDLNDYVWFAEVVRHGGFAPAGRALRQPKSKLSRRVARLEARLGVRLIERSARRFRVTGIGQSLYECCRRIMIELEQADAVVAERLSEPQGPVRLSCPTGMVETISSIVPAFLEHHPKVRLSLVVTDRPVDLIEERIDVALRVRSRLDSDASLTMRTLGRSLWILVAGPKVANAIGSGDPVALAAVPTLSATGQQGEVTWDLAGPDGETRTLRHEPRMACADFLAVRASAAANLGVTLLPDHVCAADLASGRLVHVCPGWHGPEGIIHIVFTTRRGLPPAVRAFIDHLAAAFRDGAL